MLDPRCIRHCGVRCIRHCGVLWCFFWTPEKKRRVCFCYSIGYSIVAFSWTQRCLRGMPMHGCGRWHGRGGRRGGKWPPIFCKLNMHRKSVFPILGLMPPTGLTRVVIAKVHSREPRFNWGAATAADDFTPARHAVDAVALLAHAGVPRQLPFFPQVIDPEPRFARFVLGHCIPNASVTPRDCGCLSQTATPDETTAWFSLWQREYGLSSSATAPASAVIT